METKLNKYLIFWLSQSVSQLGSAMTGFALVLWSYTARHSALTVSLMTFCNYVPYVLIGLFAGAFVDRYAKKTVMLLADSVSALGTAAICWLVATGGLRVAHIYLVNILFGCMSAFQSAASSVAVGKLAPKDKLANVSGLDSFSGNLITVLTPALAAGVYAAAGLEAILLIDLVSFAFASCVLLFAVRIPGDVPEKRERQSVLRDCRAGMSFLQQNGLLLRVLLTIALLNFFSRLTYENILSPMILARTGDNGAALGLVNACIGVGGILGGVIVSAGRKPRDSVKMIYLSAALSFLLGDLLMGVGHSTAVWCVAGIAASLPIPFIQAGYSVLVYRSVPEKMQGRVFAMQNSIQCSTIPLGILLGGFLADYVFEPFMSGTNAMARALSALVGAGAGSGMAVMFLCTGTLGSLISLLAYRRIQKSRTGASKR